LASNIGFNALDCELSDFVFQIGC